MRRTGRAQVCSGAENVRTNIEPPDGPCLQSIRDVKSPVPHCWETGVIDCGVNRSLALREQGVAGDEVAIVGNMG